jgi:hypothetical protein
MSKKYIVILAVMAVGIFALGVHLATAGTVEVQIGDTTISFLPLVMTSKAADTPPGVLYVFNAGYETNGDVGGRSLMGEICTNADPESHFCSMEEIENARVTNGVYFLVDFNASWADVVEINTGGWSSGLNCSGWTSDAGEGGFILSSFASSLDFVTCDNTADVACCKQIP